MTQILWTSDEICRITGGTCTGTWSATGLTFNSRAVTGGKIFIALKGTDFPTLDSAASDGHPYIADALKNGAAAVIAEHVPAEYTADPRVVIVASTRAALDTIAAAARARSGARVFGITGSVGKTSTRDMLALCLKTFGTTYESQKNYNNVMGVPITLANTPLNTDYSVIEMGMSYAGEMRALSQLARPDIAIITTIAPAHIQNFADGLDGIADAKGEIFDGLTPGGTAIINRDVDQFARLVAAARRAGAATILTFGENLASDARATQIVEAKNGTRVTADILGEQIDFFIPAGRHQAINALAVLLAIRAAGLDITKAAATLRHFETPEGRGRDEKLNLGDPDNPVILIDESYNASPAAMNAAFRVMALIDPGRGGRRIVVLGDMLELGDFGPKLHADLALPIRAAGIDLVYTCGSLMKHLHESLAANTRGEHRATSTDLAQIVPDVLVPGDVVMVKGSHGSKMNVVVEALRALPAKRAASQEQNRHAL